MPARGELQIAPKAPFSLAESKAFLKGFPPVSSTVRSSAAVNDALRIAFVLSRASPKHGALIECG